VIGACWGFLDFWGRDTFVGIYWGRDDVVGFGGYGYLKLIQHRHEKIG
jgi:hypothetical protein